ncbi:MAG: DUF2846 domain-containing protein [Rhodocyclales bacterium]|nr:DUF2846 domain-containing protein [Rhodocyclales bacterium]
MKKNGLVGLLLAMVVLATGCAAVPMASDEEDRIGKSFAVKPDRANVYVYRNETFGAAIPMTVAINGKVAGQTGPQTYFMWEVEPGAHEISSHAENVTTIQLTAQAGKSYYVWQEVKMGLFMARSLLQQMDEETGRKGVLECKRAQSAF